MIIFIIHCSYSYYIIIFSHCSQLTILISLTTFLLALLLLLPSYFVLFCFNNYFIHTFFFFVFKKKNSALPPDKQQYYLIADHITMLNIGFRNIQGLCSKTFGLKSTNTDF